MNVFKLLSNKAGKLVFGMAQLGGTVAVAGVLAYSAVEMAGPKPAPKETPLRSITSISRTERVPYGNSISVSGGGDISGSGSGGYAAPYDGGGYSGGGSGASYAGGRNAAPNGERQEAMLANLTLPPVARTGATEGLGTGQNEVTFVGGQNGAGGTGGATTRAGVAGLSGAVNGGGGTAVAGGNRLASASIVRSKGNSFSGTSGPITRSTAGGATTGGGQSVAQGASFSGSMPTGSVALGTRSGGFSSGRNGRADGGRGGNSREGSELASIRKRSAEVASNKTRAANEGADAFLADARNSGGISVEDGVVDTGASASSADFDSPHMGRMKGLDSGIDSEEQIAAERKHHADRLMKTMFALLGISFAAALAISALRMSAKMTPWTWIAMGAIAAAVAVAIGLFVKDAVDFKNLYGSWKGYSAGSFAAAGICGAMVAASFFKPVANFLKVKVLGAVGKLFGMKLGGVVASQAGSAKTLIDSNVEAGDSRNKAEVDPHDGRYSA